MTDITIRSSIKVKIRIFTLRRKNIEQGTEKEEGTGKQSNNRTGKHLNNGRKKKEERQRD